MRNYATDGLPSIIDGFTLNPAIRCRPGYYMASALGSMEVLRRANTYRPRWYIVPDDQNTPIAAYQTLEYQIRVTPRSYIWGLLANQFNGVFAAINPLNLWLQITDSANGIPLFSDFASARGFSNMQNVATDQRNAMLPHLLTQPRLILEPGLVTVELANTSAAAITPQLVIFTAEPCEAQR